MFSVSSSVVIYLSWFPSAVFSLPFIFILVFTLLLQHVLSCSASSSSFVCILNIIIVLFTFIFILMYCDVSSLPRHIHKRIHEDSLQSYLFRPNANPTRIRCWFLSVILFVICLQVNYVKSTMSGKSYEEAVDECVQNRIWVQQVNNRFKSFTESFTNCNLT